jgi:hypothetical protein
MSLDGLGESEIFLHRSPPSVVWNIHLSYPEVYSFDRAKSLPITELFKLSLRQGSEKEKE